MTSDPLVMATLIFSKLHGTGNDFVYVDARRGFPGDPAALAPALCDRHRGVGADGLILLLDSERADCRMKIYNADGSVAEMCGNGIRGFAKFVLDRGLLTRVPLRVETDAGIKVVEPEREHGRVARVAVDMGAPVWDGRRIPVDADGEVIERPLEVAGQEYRVTCVSMGNPHCVVFVDDVASLPLAALGPRFEHHPFFPRRVNTEFIRVAGPGALEMRVWERGAGETLACGTGACAAAAAAFVWGRVGPDVTVKQPGGNATVRLKGDTIILSGPADHIATVEVPWL